MGNLVKILLRATDGHALATSVVVNSLVFISVYLVFSPAFMTNDDVAMMLTASGQVYGEEPSEYLVHTNILVGRTLTEFYSLAPEVAWYALYLVLGLWAAHVAFLYVVLVCGSLFRSLLLYLLYFALIGCELLLSLQFTISASLLCFAGFLLIQHSTRSSQGRGWKSSSIEVAVGCALVFFGSLMRENALWMSAMIMIPVLVRRIGSGSRKRMAWKLSAIGITVLFSVLAWKYQSYEYERSGWGDFLEFNSVRAEITEYGGLSHLDQDQLMEALGAVGWSRNDYGMLIRWVFADEDRYSLAKLRTVLSHARTRGRPANFERLPDLFQVLTAPVAIRFLFVSILAMFFCWARKPAHLQILAIFALACCLFVSLTLWWKVPPERVFAPVFGFMSIFAIVLAEEGSSRVVWKSRVVRIIALGFIVGAVASVGARFSSYSKGSTAAQAGSLWLERVLREEMKPDGGELFVGWGTGMPLELILPFGRTEYLASLNLYNFGVRQRTPIMKNRLREFGIRDIFKALCQDPRVFLVVRSHQQHLLGFYHSYMRENYGLRTRSSVVSENAVFRIYRLKVVH
jgi:hypothetical protein